MLDGSLMLGGRTPLTSKLASNINIDIQLHKCRKMVWVRGATTMPHTSISSLTCISL